MRAFLIQHGIVDGRGWVVQWVVDYTESPVEIRLHSANKNPKHVRKSFLYPPSGYWHNFRSERHDCSIRPAYTPSTPHWSNISSLASTFGWTDMVAQSTSEYFDTHGVNTKFSREMIEAATRMNYGQDVDKIHALEGACSLAANSVSSVEGGNWRIFEQFLKRSNATVHLSETVQSIKRQSDEKWTVKTDRSSANYKAVIIAAPFHSTGISLPDTLASQIPPQPYVHLHVTLLTTTSAQPLQGMASPVGSVSRSSILVWLRGVPCRRYRNFVLPVRTTERDMSTGAILRLSLPGKITSARLGTSKCSCKDNTVLRLRVLLDFTRIDGFDEIDILFGCQDSDDEPPKLE